MDNSTNSSGVGLPPDNSAELLEKTLQSIEPELLDKIREARKVNSYPAGIVFNGILSVADLYLQHVDASPDDVVKLAQLIWQKTTP